MRLSRAGYLALIAGLLAALLVSLVVVLAFGSVSIGIGEVLDLLDTTKTPSDDVRRQIVRDIRLPRALLGVLVGGALAVVGGTLQATMKSPLADPYILGVSSGASVGAALAAALGRGALGGFGMSTAAFASALVSVGCVYAAARVGGRVPPIRLLLAGVAYSSFASAVTGLVLYLAPEDAKIRGYLFWLLGGLASADWPTIGWTAASVVPGVLLLMLTARWQNLLLLGDEAALSLGLDVAKARSALVILTALVTGTAVAFAGAIGFVGLLVPHAVRLLTGPDHRRLLPASMLTGALLLVWMDALARTILAPRELPVGLLTGLLGAPFFLLLLRRYQGDVHG